MQRLEEVKRRVAMILSKCDEILNKYEAANERIKKVYFEIGLMGKVKLNDIEVAKRRAVEEFLEEIRQVIYEIYGITDVEKTRSFILSGKIALESVERITKDGRVISVFTKEGRTYIFDSAAECLREAFGVDPNGDSAVRVIRRICKKNNIPFIDVKEAF